MATAASVCTAIAISTYGVNLLTANTLYHAHSNCRANCRTRSRQVKSEHLVMTQEVEFVRRGMT